jgi:hypothetical protein
MITSNPLRSLSFTMFGDPDCFNPTSNSFTGQGEDCSQPPNAAPSRLLALWRRLVVLAIIGGALWAAADTAHAQVRVDGGPEAVHLEASNVSLRDVLAALQEKFNLRFRTDDALEKRKTGVFDGTLPRVAARILDGYDFAMKITPQGIDVLVLRQNQADGRAVSAELPIRAALKRSSAPEANRYEREHFR